MFDKFKLKFSWNILKTGENFMQNSHFTRRIAFVFIVLLTLFFAELDVRADGTQVSSNLQPNQSLSNYRVSADGKYAVYKISSLDVNYNESVQLFSVNLAANDRKALTPVIGGDGKTFGEYQITPDSQYVVYNASLEADAFFRAELYSIPIGATSQNQRKNIGNIPASFDGDIFNFYISPDSRHVVYQTSDENAAYESFRILYRVAPTGGATTQLTPRVADGEAENVIFTPDSSRIVYQFDSPATDGNTIYQSVSISGTGRKTLTNETSGGSDPAITSDSLRLVFTADFSPENDNIYETALHSITLSGSEARKQLSKSGEDVSTFRLAKDYPVAVYAFKLANDPGYSPTAFGFAVADKSYESVSYNTGKELDSYNYAISPNNSSLIYIAGGYGASQLYSLTFQNNAGFEKQLSVAPASAGPFTGISDFKIAPNGARVVFRATQGSAYTPDLYSVAISNNPLAVKLDTLAAETGANASDYGVGSYFITPNSARVIFGYSRTDGNCCGNNFYTNAITGGTPTAAFATNANDDQYSGGFPILTADARRLVYTKTVYDVNFNPTTSLWTALVP